jgi:hypothetical protein
MEDLTAFITDDEKQRLQELLTTPQFREFFRAVLDIGMGNLEYNMSNRAYEGTVSIGRKVYETFASLSQRLGINAGIGSNLDNIPDAEKQMAKRLLTAAGHDVAIGVDAFNLKKDERFAKDNQLGLMSIADIRRHIGRALLAVGNEAESLLQHDNVNPEQIGSQIITEITADVRNSALDSDQNRGNFTLCEYFVADFLRGPVMVNGQLYGGGGTNIPEETKREKLQQFIDAVGGLEKAKQIARIANQQTLATMINATARDPGLGPVQQEFMAFQGVAVPRDSSPPRYNITVEGDNVQIHFEEGQQNRAIDGSGREWGRNMALDITIQGAGTDDPVVRLDGWDVIFSSRTV